MLSIFTVPLLTLCSVSAGRYSRRSELPPVIGGWYTNRPANNFPVHEISWEKYNTMYYSFATTTSSVDSLSLDDTHGDSLTQFVSDAQSHGVEAHIAVGGWFGSVWFSSNIASSENRTAFVKTLTDFVHKYKLDGIQFDWEYPGKQGVGCNTVAGDDTSNYLLFLQELRKNTAGTNLTLSAAVPLKPFMDSSGNPSVDVSGFSYVLDYITLMNYDVWGPWSAHVGPNAPLNDTCASPENQQGSAVSAIKAWTGAGMPINKIVLGVASYGHSFSVSPSAAFDSGSKPTPDAPGRKTLAAYPTFDASKQPLGDAWDDMNSVDVCGTRHGPDGRFRFWGLVDAGFLNQDGTLADGIYVRYDECSQTPYVYNETSQVMVSFDNPQSFAAKGKFIEETGLRGFAMWEVPGDYDDMLLDSIREAMGVDYVSDIRPSLSPEFLDTFPSGPAPNSVPNVPNLVPAVPNPVPGGPRPIPDFPNLVPNVLNTTHPGALSSVPNSPDLPLSPDPVPDAPNPLSNGGSNSVPHAPNLYSNGPNSVQNAPKTPNSIPNASNPGF